MTNEEAINFLKSINKEDTAVCCDGALFTLDEYGVEIISMAIEALRVDLVRCGECVHSRRPWDGICEHPTAEPGDTIAVNKNDFCSYGERSEQ